MTSERWQRVQELFHEAAGRGPGERGSFLDQACGDDAELRAEVESLLTYDAEAPADFMRPAEGGPEADPDGKLNAPDPLIGTRISRYQIKRVIATGGMGTVYEAEQDNPRRIVALKLMRAGVTSRTALRHFEREAQILARLRHPNIAQVFEAGTHLDRSTGGSTVPYFAMEYVPDALTIDRYVEERQLDVRERLELFVQVCEAVHHGHQKGIIHRDLKPGNVLVDSSGLAKIIDFGVACSTDSDVAVTTMKTDVGQLLGTLQYMSPEQCDADPQDLDVRSDVYSLGVVLYELLTGEVPYNTGGTTIYKAVKIIKECVPQKPSSINSRLRGDLEIIVLKALTKDREKRYQAAADLAHDIRHYLNREPIEAKPLTTWGRAVRWMGQHPVIVPACTSLGFALVTVGATLGSIWWFGLQPYKVELTPDGREARLLSVTGLIRHAWSGEQDKSVSSAVLLQLPGKSSRRSLALVGFTARTQNRFRGKLCAFPVTGDRDTPVWCSPIKESDLPPKLRELGISPAHFGVDWSTLGDVFPEIPGQEIIALHGYSTGGVSAIRVYDRDGNRLFEVWHDGWIKSGYWMSEAGILVCTGFNSEVPWSQRGHPEALPAVPYPVVVFAVRPQLNSMSSKYLPSTPTQDSAGPVWYKCLFPAAAYGPFGDVQLQTPGAGLEPARSVYFNLDAPVLGTSVRLAINEYGEIVPGTLVVGARYQMTKGLPDPEQFELRGLPSIVSGTEPSDVRSDQADP